MSLDPSPGVDYRSSCGLCRRGCGDGSRFRYDLCRLGHPGFLKQIHLVSRGVVPEDFLDRDQKIGAL